MYWYREQKMRRWSTASIYGTWLCRLYCEEILFIVWGHKYYIRHSTTINNWGVKYFFFKWLVLYYLVNSRYKYEYIHHRESKGKLLKRKPFKTILYVIFLLRQLTTWLGAIFIHVSDFFFAITKHVKLILHCQVSSIHHVL